MKQIMKEITTNDQKKIYRCSRWIKVKHNYNPNKRNSLYYYTCDGYGYREGTENYNPVDHDGKYIDWFCWNNRKWAIEQFLKKKMGNSVICLVMILKNIIIRF